MTTETSNDALRQALRTKLTQRSKLIYDIAEGEQKLEWKREELALLTQQIDDLGQDYSGPEIKSWPYHDLVYKKPDYNVFLSQFPVTGE